MHEEGLATQDSSPHQFPYLLGVPCVPVFPPVVLAEWSTY